MPLRWVSHSMGGRENILPVDQELAPCSGHVIDVHCHQQGEVLEEKGPRTAKFW